MDNFPEQMNDTDVPLVLDVDGTLLRTDLLYESFWSALGHDFFATLRVLFTHWRRPERLKQALIEIDRLSVDLLPVRDKVCAMAREAKEAGRPVHLVSGANQALIDELAASLSLPGDHYGSDSERNLTDATKATFLKARFGAGRYDYAGDANVDLESWAGARKVIAVNPDAELVRKISALNKPVEKISDGWRVKDILREIRPHQWTKNALLFVPLLASHGFSSEALVAVCLAAVAFSLGASSIYVLNDLLDLEADRSHPEKRFRPIASGRLPIAVAMRLSVFLALLAIGLALSVDLTVALLTLTYMAGSLSYSLWWKKRRWLDLLALTGLFLLRLLTGAFAAGTTVTPHLLVLGFVVFFTLACVKRLTALSRMPTRHHLPGRGYSHSDLIPLGRAAYASVGLSGAAFLVYVWDANAAGFYSTPLVAAMAALPVMIWLFRMVRLSIAGREDYDPVRFVLRDRTGLSLIAICAILLTLAV
jgi:4-hydroxybenzoate polyprenyltransferase